MKFSTQFLAAGALLSASLPAVLGKPDCRYLPGDSGWPSDLQWKLLNVTVGGRLIKTVPLATPCHGPSYDAAACESLGSQWLNPQLQ